MKLRQRIHDVSGSQARRQNIGNANGGRPLTGTTLCMQQDNSGVYCSGMSQHLVDTGRFTQPLDCRRRSHHFADRSVSNLHQVLGHSALKFSQQSFVLAGFQNSIQSVAAENNFEWTFAVIVESGHKS